MNEGKGSVGCDPVGSNGTLKFVANAEARSVLDTIVRDGARQMLQAALENEVNAFLERHSSRVDDQGRRLVVRNGYLPSREIVTGAGQLEVQQPRVRDKSPLGEERVRFSSSILPAYLRRSKAIDELLLWLYRVRSATVRDFGTWGLLA